MAGLLDFGSNPYAGLLSEEDLAGARRQATTDALLKLSSGLFQAGAPSRTPQSLGAALVGGLQGVGAGYQGTLQQAAQQKLMQQKLQADLQSKQRTANAQNLVGGLYRPAQAATQGIMDSPDVVVPPRPATPGGINQDVMSQLMALGPEGQKAIMDRLGMQKMMQPEMFSVGEGAVQYSRDPFSGAVTEVASGAPKMSDLERQFNFAKSPQGGGYTGTFEQFKAITAPKTTNIVNPLQPDKKMAGDLQATLLTAGDRRMRYNQIDATFDSKFLTVPYRTEQAWTSLKEKFVELPEEQKDELRRFANWKQNSVNNLSLTIKELTGAAMGVEEAKRIIAGLPNPGTGLTDGDSPTEFKAKLDQTMQQMKLVEARTTYLLKNGLTLDKVPLEKMPSIINERGKQIATQYKLNPSKPRDLDLIKKQLSAEFGISTQ
jgi:hypothetical protein